MLFQNQDSFFYGLKFALKDYGAENKKLQDLVGVRINLYFDDDVEICQNIVENTFDVIIGPLRKEARRSSNLRN